MIPNAQKLPRIQSALLVTVFTSFLIIFCIKYLIICEKMLSFKVEVYLCYTFYFVIYFFIISNFLNITSNYIGHSVFQDIGIGCQKTNIGQTLVFESQNELPQKVCFGERFRTAEMSSKRTSFQPALVRNCHICSFFDFI